LRIRRGLSTCEAFPDIPTAFPLTFKPLVWVRLGIPLFYAASPYLAFLMFAEKSPCWPTHKRSSRRWSHGLRGAGAASNQPFNLPRRNVFEDPHTEKSVTTEIVHKLQVPRGLWR